jgi:cell division septum initiation protein DivIVA
MSDEQSSGTDLIPGMVTMVEQTVPVLPGEPPAPIEPSTRTDHFDVVLRGYERHQVDTHLRALAVLVEQLREELTESSRRDSVLSADLARLRGENERGRPSFEALGERVAQMLSLAESEASQLRADAEKDAAALRQAADQEAANTRSAARREAEELGAAARREVVELSDQRVVLLTEIAAIRDTLNSVLAATSEQWPSLAPSEDSLPLDGADEPATHADEDLEATQVIEVPKKPRR